MRAPTRPRLLAVLTDEGLRLFFPLAALHAALWPVLWVAVMGFSLPLARTVPPHLWHGHEMIVGAYGAALLGFIATAVPEWTDTGRPSERTLLTLAGLWGAGRLVGLLGADVLGAFGALVDLAWLCWLPAYVARVSFQKRTTRLTGFVFWLSALAAAEGATRAGFLLGDLDLAAKGLSAAGLAFLGLLGLALARIAVPVTNLVLDPSEETSPYRPHPGRQNLSVALVGLVLAGDLAGVSPEVGGYLRIAAGAAFLDRCGEAFVGRAFFRAEILALAGSALLAGLGLMAVGAARLGAPLAETPGLHLTLQGGLGLGVMAVFCIAGLMHTGRALAFPRGAKAALALIALSVALRVLPPWGLMPEPPGGAYLAGSLLWAAGFLVWLATYWPFLSDPASIGKDSC